MLKQLLNNYCNDKTNVICPTATVSSQPWFLVRLTTLMNLKICPVPSKHSTLFCFACWSEWHTIPSQAVALSCQAADICRKTTGFRFSRDYDERAYFFQWQLQPKRGRYLPKEHRSLLCAELHTRSKSFYSRQAIHLFKLNFFIPQSRKQG